MLAQQPFHSNDTHAAWAALALRQRSAAQCVRGGQLLSRVSLHRRQWDRWFMMGSIGITVGIIGYFLFFSIELLSDLKYRTVRCSLPAASEALMVWTSCCHGVTISAVERLAHPVQPRWCREIAIHQVHAAAPTTKRW